MIISFIFDHVIDAYVILAVVLINAIIGFVQERKDRKSNWRVKKNYVVSYAKVYRDDKLLKIPSKEIVLGDIIY